MKRLFLLSFLIPGLTLITTAQENENRNLITLSWGPGHLTRQDLVFSPFIHNDPGFLNAGLDYTRLARNFQQLRIRYSGYAPMLTEPYEFLVHGELQTAWQHLFTFIDLDYMLGKRIKSTGRLHLTAGGLFTSDIQALNYVYGRLGYFGYYAAIGLGGFLRFDYRPGEKHGFGTALQVPFASWAARSPYLVNDDEFIENTASHSGVRTFLDFLGDGEIATWDRLQYFDLNIYYSYRLNARWQVGAGYMLEFIHFTSPRNLLSAENTFSLYATIRF